MADSIAKRTADTILQKPKTVTLGGRTFEVAPPCCATLIEFSRLVPKVPYVDSMGDRNAEILAAAKDTGCIFEQMAILILGAKELSKRTFFGKSKVKELSEWLKMNCRPSELNGGMAEILGMMELGDFFELTTSLQEISLLQQMRKVEETTTTASGR